LGPFELGAGILLPGIFRIDRLGPLAYDLSFYRLPTLGLDPGYRDQYEKNEFAFHDLFFYQLKDIKKMVWSNFF
jgi:hypothetical protein